MEDKILNVGLIRLGAQISRIRKSLEIPVSQFPTVTEIEATRLECIEKGLEDPTYLELLIISRALDYRIHHLVYFDITV